MKPLSPPRRVPRLLALALVMTLSGASHAAEPESCGVVGPSVFNVKENGTISFGSNNNSSDQNTNCNIQFVNTPLVNVTDPNYYAGQNYNGSTCTPTASGATLGNLPLPSHLCTNTGCVVSARDKPVLRFGGVSAGQVLSNTETICVPAVGCTNQTTTIGTSTAISIFDNVYYYTVNEKLYYYNSNGNKYTLVDNYDGATSSGATSFNLSNLVIGTTTDTSNYKDISVEGGTSVTLVKNNPTKDFVIEKILLRDQGSSITLINGKYGTLSNIGDSTVYFKYNKNTPNIPYIIDKMAFSNNTVLNMEPGDYYINSFENSNALVLNVVGEGDGSGKVRLYINGGTSTTLAANAGSCYNIKNVTTVAQCASFNQNSPTASVTDQQDATKLAFYVYNGDLKSDNIVSMAASVYVNNGTLNLNNNANSMLVGEVLAKNIWIENSSATNTLYAYQETNIFDELYQEASGTIPSHEGYYQLAPTAHPKRATTDELAFIPYQQDYLVKDGVTQKRGGHVQAFAYKADGATESTPTWDANTHMILLAQVGRALRLKSNDDDGYPELMSIIGAAEPLLVSEAFGCTITDLVCTAKAPLVVSQSIAGPTLGTLLPSLKQQWDSIIGLPNSTKPLIYRNKVIFSTSDGYLYAVDRQSGEMQWGWMPRPLLAGLMDYEKFLLSDPMQGQLVGIPAPGTGLLEDPNSVDKSGIILGTAKGGALHYAIKLDDEGDLDKVLWMDARKASEVGDKGSAKLYGDLSGSSPNAAEQVVFGDKTLYIVNNRIITRNYANGNDDDTITPDTGITLTSTPLVALQKYGNVTKNVLFVGDSKGDIYTLDLSPNNNPITLSDADKLTKSDSAKFGEPEPALAAIKYLTYTRMGDYEYLTAQSDTRLTVFKRQISDASSAWVREWTTDDSGTQAASADHVQTIPKAATFSARVSVAGGVVSAPVSVYNATTCLADGYSYFFNLADGKFPMSKVKYLGTTLITENKLLGSGMATESTIQAFKGKLSFQSQSEQNVGTTSGTGTTKADGADDRFEIVGGSLIERRGWREIYE